MRKILACLATGLMALGSSAAELDIMPLYTSELCWSGAAMSGNTASWTEGYGGIVFNLDNKDYSEYNYIVMDFEQPTPAKFKLEAYYSDESNASSNCEADATSTRIVLRLDNSKKDEITKIALMSAKPGSANITKAVLVDELDIDPVLFEGRPAVPDMKEVYFKLGAEKFLGLTKGQTLTIHFTTGTLQQYASVDIYSNNTKLKCQDGRTNVKKNGQFALTTTVTSTVINDDNDIASLQSYGLQLKGRNVTITKVTLTDGGTSPETPEKPDTPNIPGDGVLWSGSTSTGSWKNDITVDAPKFSAIKAGDKIAIYLNVESGKDYGNIELDDQKYTKLDTDGSSADLDSYGCIQADVTKVTYEIGAADVALLKSNGLRIKGANITVTKVELIGGQGVETPAENTIWTGSTSTGSWKNDITVDAPKFSAIKAGDKIAIYLNVESGKDYGNIELDDQKYTKLDTDGSSADLDSYGCIQADVTKVTYEIGAADVALLKSNGLRIKGANITVTKVELIGGQGVETPAENTIWTGSTSTGSWKNDITVDAPKFSNVKGGDILKILLNVNAGNDYGNIELDDQTYVKLETDRTSANLDSYGCIQPDVTELTYVITNNDAASLKANGLRVKGANITVTGIQLSSGDPLPDNPDTPAPGIESEIWSGNVNCGQWAQSVTVAADKFENAREGDRFKINLTINAGKGKGIVKVQSGDMVDLTVNGKGTNMDSAGNFKRGAKDAVYEINVTDLEKLKAHGLVISGFAVTVTKVSLITVDQSGIDDIGSDTTDMPVEYYNLNGMRVDNPANGIFIRRQGNKVSKIYIR